MNPKIIGSNLQNIELKNQNKFNFLNLSDLFLKIIALQLSFLNE